MLFRSVVTAVVEPLGLRGIVIKSHGSADVYAFGQALERAVDEVRNSVPQRIAERMAQLQPAQQQSQVQ